jgi:hypothetical protein
LLFYTLNQPEMPKTGHPNMHGTVHVRLNFFCLINVLLPFMFAHPKSACRYSSAGHCPAKLPPARPFPAISPIARHHP